MVNPIEDIIFIGAIRVAELDQARGGEGIFADDVVVREKADRAAFFDELRFGREEDVSDGDDGASINEIGFERALRCSERADRFLKSIVEGKFCFVELSSVDRCRDCFRARFSGALSSAILRFVYGGSLFRAKESKESRGSFPEEIGSSGDSSEFSNRFDNIEALIVFNTVRRRRVGGRS
jgi:hypothetical protein